MDNKSKLSDFLPESEIKTQTEEALRAGTEAIKDLHEKTEQIDLGPIIRRWIAEKLPHIKSEDQR